MTTLRVDGEAIRTLGADLTVLAEVLAALGEGQAAPGSVTGHASVSAALDELLGNWSMLRRRLSGALDDLGAAAAQAGTAYLLVENGIVDSLGCTPAACPASSIQR
ncbi:MAG: hypothetical protein GXY39_09885 [Actinomycetales bacterium]|nr:hypothetical protein [Tetrasphaera sp.]NLX00001.1 hypothetical protein [Actinomycetales bacterium]